MGVLGPCPERAGGCWEGAGHEGDKVRASVGCHLNKRVVVPISLFATICTIWDFKWQFKERGASVQML